ncbi:hypothetical protein M436DRAFT_64342 [Aureobasidium namibiae CBS 147.97]|uniref:Uncharacterized protein n=1 Tax=Aureobasidium namibiae CBS 147.97 TaxID=1043004 RepID=A0A074WRJ6_9PEZI
MTGRQHCMPGVRGLMATSGSQVGPKEEAGGLDMEVESLMNMRCSCIPRNFSEAFAIAKPNLPQLSGRDDSHLVDKLEWSIILDLVNNNHGGRTARVLVGLTERRGSDILTPFERSINASFLPVLTHTSASHSLISIAEHPPHSSSLSREILSSITVVTADYVKHSLVMIQLLSLSAPLRNFFELELLAVYILPYQTTADNLSSLNIARIMGNIAHIIHDIARFVKYKGRLSYDAHFASRAPIDLSLIDVSQFSGD